MISIVTAVEDIQRLGERRQLTVVVGAGVTAGSVGAGPWSSWLLLLQAGIDRVLEVSGVADAGAWAHVARQQLELGDLESLISVGEAITLRLGGMAGGP